MTISGMPTVANILGSLLFGSIGFGAFIYGKKQAEWKPMVVGIALMAFPYFISQTIALYIVGTLLSITLFF